LSWPESLRNQISHAPRDHARLPAARSGDDQKRAVDMNDSLALRVG